MARLFGVVLVVFLLLATIVGCGKTEPTSPVGQTEMTGKASQSISAVIVYEGVAESELQSVSVPELSLENMVTLSVYVETSVLPPSLWTQLPTDMCRAEFRDGEVFLVNCNRRAYKIVLNR